MYLNLYLHNFVIIEDIVNSYNYENLTALSGSFSHISPTIDSVFFKTFSNINIVSIARYGFLILISTIPFIYFIKIKSDYENKYFNFQNIFISIILLSIPLYSLIFDWGRIIYINYNFFIILLLFFFKLNLIDLENIDKKIMNLNFLSKSLFLIVICFMISPDIMSINKLEYFPLPSQTLRFFDGIFERIIELY